MRVPIPLGRFAVPFVLLALVGGVAAVVAGKGWAATALTPTPTPTPGATVITPDSERASDWRQLELSLEGSDGEPRARLVVAASGNTAAVAAVPLVGAGPGRLWVVERDGGVASLRPRVFAVGLDGTDVEVGSGLAVEGRTLVVGAPEAAEGAGVVWLVRDTSRAGDWSTVATVRVQPPRPVPGAHFGRVVALSGRLAVVGAPLDGSRSHGVGSLWAVRDTSEAGDWSATEVGALWPGGVNLDDRLGAAVALDGRTLVVGVPLKDTFAPSGGGAFVMRDISPEGGFAHWRTIRLRPTGVGYFEGFGRAVAVSGRMAVVGGRGAVWVFRDTSMGGDWSEVAETRVRPVGVGPSFGSAVAASGGVVLVGEPDASRSGTLSGAVWAVEPPEADAPARVVAVSPTGLGPFDRLGHTIAVAGDRAVVGAWRRVRAGAKPAGGAWLLMPAVFVTDFESGTTSEWGEIVDPRPSPTPKPKRRRRR